MEKTLIKASFHKKNKFARVVLTLSIIIMIAALIMGVIYFISAINEYDTGGYSYSYTYSPIYYNGHLVRDGYTVDNYEYYLDSYDSFFDFFTSYRCDKSGFFYALMLLGIAVFGIILQGIVRRKKNHCELTVTNMRIFGKTSFGKVVDLPLRQITAVNLGSSDRISVSTASGTIHFWLLENKEAVYKVFTAIIAQLQSEKPSQAQAKPDTITELKRYKELLDSGIITQEEFETKKEQLLNH